MVRYIVTLFVSVVFIATAFVAWTPVAKSQQQDCSAFCKEKFICACASKLLGILRVEECEFSGTQECPITAQLPCDCGTPTADCLRKESPFVWLAVPEPVDPCLNPT